MRGRIARILHANGFHGGKHGGTREDKTAKIYERNMNKFRTQQSVLQRAREFCKFCGDLQEYVDYCDVILYNVNGLPLWDAARGRAERSEGSCGSGSSAVRAGVAFPIFLRELWARHTGPNR